MFADNNMAPDNAASSTDSVAVSSVFQMFQLPGEIRHQIYRHYFGSWDAEVEYERKSASFKIRGFPSLDLMLASRATYMECYHLIPAAFSGRLLLRDVRVCRERGFGFVSSLDVIGSLCPTWLLQRIVLLMIEQGTTSLLVSLPWYKLTSLREVHLEGGSLPRMHCHPCGLSVRAKRAHEDHLYEGQFDTWRVHGYNNWSQVPKPVSEGQVRVVTIREGHVKGAALKVRVEHKADHAEVRDRWINSVLRPNIQSN